MLPMRRMYSSTVMPSVNTSCCACRSYNSLIRNCRSDKPSSGPDKDADNSTVDRAWREAEKSPVASASPFLCWTTTSMAFRRALSWFSRASR